VTEKADLTVCCNGACPVCRADVEHHRRLADAGARLGFLDAAADPASAARRGLVGEVPFRRLHVVSADGRVLAGVEASAAVWERLPRCRWLAGLARRPVVGAVARLACERVAAPALLAPHRRRRRRHTPSPAPGPAPPRRQ
jgi:predicted DCC family thiol-disulfide oxidoreductase YuxK